jgi:CheY-like chemotaxis protein
MGIAKRCRPLILIVADNPATRTRLDALLTGYGYETLTESDGPAALDLVDSMVPGSAQIAYVILVDGRASIVEGYELAAALRRRTVTANVPLICMSALSPRAVSARVQNILGSLPALPA